MQIGKEALQATTGVGRTPLLQKVKNKDVFSLSLHSKIQAAGEQVCFIVKEPRWLRTNIWDELNQS